MIKNTNKFDTILFFQIFLISFGNIGGALTPSRLFALLLIPLLFLKFKDCNYYTKPFVFFFTVFYAYIFISIIWTPNTQQGFKELIYFPIHIIYFLEILVFARYAKFPLKSIALGWTVMIFICSFIAGWELLTDNHLEMAKQETGQVSNTEMGIVNHFTASATFGNPNSYVTNICFSFPWIIYTFMQKSSNILRLFVSFFAFTMSILVILFNMSRGGLLSFVIMGLIYFLLSRKSFKKTFLLIAIVGTIIYLLINYGVSVIAIMEARTAGGGLIQDDSRFAIWIVCIKLLLDTFLFGVGVGGAEVALSNASNNIVPAPHSLFFEILLQYGLIFVLVFVLFYLQLLVKSWKIQNWSCRVVNMMCLCAFPIFTIINSTYLLGLNLFALIATLYLFVNVDMIKKQYKRVYQLS